jgi:hypothetical protein
MARFHGTQSYVATDDLKVAVNAAIVLERPLLVKGEPGTGKTVLAEEIAKAIGARSSPGTSSRPPRPSRGSTNTTPSRACAIAARRPARLGRRNYIKRGKVWDAFAAETRPVLLIDEIDKADIEFPNDLLLELDRMEFHVYETGETGRAARRPDRHHHLEQREGAAGRLSAPLLLPLHQFPDAETMNRIVEVHYPGIKRRLSRRRCASSSTSARRRASRKSPRPRNCSTG